MTIKNRMGKRQDRTTEREREREREREKEREEGSTSKGRRRDDL